MDMRSGTLEVVYTNSTHEFTPKTRVHPVNFLAKSAEKCRMALGVVWYYSNHGFTLITLLLSGKSLWTLVDMRSVTFEVVYTNFTHEVTPVTRLHPINTLGKSA